MIRMLRKPGITLDLGCGQATETQNMIPHVLIDLRLREAPERSPDDLIVCDFTLAPQMFQTWRFGTCYMIDTIEHLHRAQGEKLLPEIEALCDRVAVFTPLGELWVTPESDNPHAHRSGWTPAEFEQRGYHVWEWPIYHKWPDGHVHGAFWAWKDRSGSLTPLELAKLACVQA